MAERYPIDRNPLAPGNTQFRTLHCEEWESLIPEAMDGMLPAADLAAFEHHSCQCAACARMLEEARQGALWLGFLERQPEPAAGLLQKILSQTSGAAAHSLPTGQTAYAGLPVAPVPVAAAWARGRHSASSPTPRLLMTTAMAFFSLTLILNLTGVNLSKVDLSDFRPSTLRVHLTRQYYSANARVVRYYENLRFVYEMETRMRDLQRSAESQPEFEPAPDSPSRSPGSHSPVSWIGGAHSGWKAIESAWTRGLSDRTCTAQAQRKGSLA